MVSKFKLETLIYSANYSVVNNIRYKVKNLYNLCVIILKQLINFLATNKSFE